MTDMDEAMAKAVDIGENDVSLDWPSFMTFFFFTLFNYDLYPLACVCLLMA